MKTKTLAAATATETRKTTIEVDARQAAKLRAILRLCSRSYTLEDLVAEWFRNLLEIAPLDVFLQECATRDRCDDWPKLKHQIVRAKIKRICDGDYLIRSEPLARNTTIFSQTFPRLVDAAREKNTTPNVMATTFVEWCLNQMERGEITFGETNAGGAK